MEIDYKDSPILNLAYDLFHPFLNKIRKLRHYAHLFIVSFKCAKFQQKLIGREGAK